MIRPTRTSSSGGGATVYIGTDGSDSVGNGTRVNPYASLQKALDRIGGSGEIIMLEGDYETKANVILDMTTARNLIIRAEPLTRVRVFLGEKVTSFTQVPATIRWTATVAAGYDMGDRSTDAGAYDSMCWVFEMDTKEGIITDPLPQQRGRTHRLDHSRLWLHTGTAAVEAANARFAYSGTTLSISATDGGNPNGRTYWIPSQTPLTSFVHSGTAATRLIIDGIDIYFGFNCVDFSGCSRAEMRNCLLFGSGAVSAGFAGEGLDTYGGEGMYAANFGSIYEENNEYACCANDGAGPYSSDVAGQRAKITAINTWAHDNGDSGYSNHALTDLVMTGGLFENNCSSGMTHALGTQFSCYSPHTRANGLNFTGIGGDTGEGGIVSAVAPGVNCVIHGAISEGDTVAFFNSTNGTRINIQAIEQTGTTVLVTTTTNHNFFPGQKISVSGVTTSGYNLEGATVVTTPLANTFTYVTTGGLTSPGAVGPGVCRLVTKMNIYRPIVRNPTLRAFQNSTGSQLDVYEPVLEGVATLIAGNIDLFFIHDRRRAFMAYHTGASYSGAAAKMSGWTDQSNAYDRSGVFANNIWTPGKIGLHHVDVTLVSNITTRVILHLYKNGNPFKVLFDSATFPYKSNAASATFYNALLADYYELWIQTTGGGPPTIDVTADANTDTQWTGWCLSEG